MTDSDSLGREPNRPEPNRPDTWTTAPATQASEPDGGAPVDPAVEVRPEPPLDLPSASAEDRKPWLASLGLGLVGALVGGAIVLAALLGGALPGFSGRDDESLSSRVTGLEQDLASVRDATPTLTNRVAALETALRQAQSDATNAVNLAQEAKSDADRAQAAAPQTTPTQSTSSQSTSSPSASGESTPSQASQSPVTAGDVSALQDRLAKLESRPENPAADELKSLSGAVAELRSQAGQAQGTLAEVPALKSGLASVTERLHDALAGRKAAGVVALDALDAALRTGQPFETELKTAAALGEGNDLATLQPLATTGVTSLPSLQAAFASAAPAMRTALAPTPERPSSDAGVLDRLGFSLSHVVSVRRSDEAQVDPTRPVGEIEAALNRGDVAGALTAYAALPEAARQPGAAWAAQARSRVAAESAVAAARARALEAIATSSTAAGQ